MRYAYLGNKLIKKLVTDVKEHFPGFPNTDSHSSKIVRTIIQEKEYDRMTSLKPIQGLSSSKFQRLETNNYQ